MSDPTLLVVPNISEGRDHARIDRITGGAPTLLDTHSDPDHHRTVLTYGGGPDRVIDEVCAMCDRALDILDLAGHDGVHPRHGAVDVVAVVPYRCSEQLAREAAERFIEHLRRRIDVHTYGRADPDRRSLPQVRRTLPASGATCVGVRDLLVAFNVTVDPGTDVTAIVRRLRRHPDIRALAFELPSRGLRQVSMNLLAPGRVGPAEALAMIDLPIVDCEVAGLAPRDVLERARHLPWAAPPRSIEDALGG